MTSIPALDRQIISNMVSPKASADQEQQATPPVPTSPTKIDPLIALELRLRWLEALILGVKQDLGRDAAIANLKHGETLSRLAETVQQKLDKAVEGNEGLTKFMNQCMLSSNTKILFWYINVTVLFSV